jgi:hypothetical protein
LIVIFLYYLCNTILKDMKKPKKNTKNILLRLPPKLADRVSKTAERESRSLNGQIIYELSANEKE